MATVKLSRSEQRGNTRNTMNGSKHSVYLTTADVAPMKERELLRWVVNLYQMEHPEVKAVNAIAARLHISRIALTNYMAGKGGLTPSQWVTVYSLTRSPLIPAWFDFNVHFPEMKA